MAKAKLYTLFHIPSARYVWCKGRYTKQYWNTLFNKYKYICIKDDEFLFTNKFTRCCMEYRPHEFEFIEVDDV